jgi:hypothetical protein
VRNDQLSILINCKYAGVILALTSVQFIWMTLFISFKVGLINFLPTLIFLTIWYLFVQVEIKPKYFWFCFSLGWLITLRLPLTIARFLEPLQWFLYFIVAGLVLYKIVQYYRLRQQLALLIVTTIIILFNSLSHISLNSPYTYSFRIVNNLPSAYASNVDNNSTWECPYESSTFMVSCDMRHTIAVEKIFTDAKYDASFSVYLLRFYYGYLSSLIGFDGHRWIASLTLNLLFWLFACAALYKTCILTKLSKRAAAIAMLCCASSWGFVSFVGQPAMYLAAYAFAAIMIWSTLEIVYSQSIKKQILFSLIIVSGCLIYDVYPLTLSCLTLIFISKKYFTVTSILFVQVLLNLLWSKFFLEKVLGSIGNQKNSGNVHDIKNSLDAWINVASKLDITQATEFIGKGTQAYIYGGMVFGVVASSIFIICLLIVVLNKKERGDGSGLLSLIPSPISISLLISSSDKSAENSNRLLLVFSCSICFLVLLSTIFINPASHHWSPNSGMMPRLAFYTYPINTIAIAVLADVIVRNKAFIVAVITFLISNTNQK